MHPLKHSLHLDKAHMTSIVLLMHMQNDLQCHSKVVQHEQHSGSCCIQIVTNDFAYVFVMKITINAGIHMFMYVCVHMTYDISVIGI